ncbi:MAG: chemotaxis response regulator protein-glutamate methylesterase [Planctomycetaceae bacterium]
MSSPKIRVLIVDDSAVVRGLLSRALESDDRIEVAGTAMHGQSAISHLRRQLVDVVLMDVEMPVMDGLTALGIILKEFPKLPVVMVSSLTQAGAETTVQALSLGAAGCIAKPATSSTSESISLLVDELVPMIKALANPSADPATPATTGWRSSSLSPTADAPARTPKGFAPHVVVIGSSTGGPRALTEVLTNLHPDFSLPILIVQHMPPMFTPLLARRLELECSRPCREGTNGSPIEGGHMYVAPGDFHMEIARRGEQMMTILHRNEPEHFCRPSVNPLFRTAAQWYRGNVLAVMLTGMGDDGIEGTREIAAGNGYVIAQDRASSIVWGMPGAVVRERLAHQVLPLDMIAPTLNRICCTENATL